MDKPTKKALVPAILWGITSVALYASLYYFEKPILEASAKGGWYFIVPVTIAFIFSGVHGNFTGYFWEALGVRAKKK
ncbi:hypothetical protein [Candidatus Albibeggiatoa sp. nov. NOAA]|uniref:hypothetical protein n=1 Tax=Candidatus Albibeggiatoa sp. nov. NOAA TaxID=3162724 RepID=UPI0032FF1CE0|nr:hypothetical protein [Thiotrichaceae bacterium]